MFQLVRSNPGLLIILILLLAGAFVCGVMGLMMARSGVSLRPIYWFAGLFALIVGPQLIAQFYRAVTTTNSEAPRTAALEQFTTPTDANATARSDAAKFLFGPDADPQLISDVRRAYEDVFANAELAQFAVLPNGETVLLARFNGYSAAEKAWVNYLRVSGLNQMRGQGDSQRGYAVTRPVGDRAYVLHSGNMVGIWTAKDDAAIRQRMVASSFEVPRRAPLAGVSPQAGARKTRTSISLGLIAALIALNLFVFTFYFFKGAAWAGTSPAPQGVGSAAAQDLAARLEAVNSLDVPFRIERGVRTNEFFATWRYADAKWIDLARARGMNRTFRIRLFLDENDHTVRATDYVASFDWSAGRGGASIEWKTGLGIVFFQQEHQRVFGLQLDDQGRFKPELSYAYTFNLNEMKSPLITVVNRAGWNWRPTIWQGPTWLRWLTE